MGTVPMSNMEIILTVNTVICFFLFIRTLSLGSSITELKRYINSIENAEDLKEQLSVTEELYLEASKKNAFNEGKLRGLEEADPDGGWKEEAIEWREVAIPFVKKHLGL